MEKRNPKKDAAIGVIAGLGGGIISSAITHPLDTYTGLKQNPNPAIPTDFPVWKAPFKARMWEGILPSAFRKGINYGISMGTMFAISSLIRNALDNRSMKNLGFHKSK